MSLPGILSALAAPLLITFGLAIWAELWSGHAIALNLYKCTAASCMFMVVLTGYGVGRIPLIDEDTSSSDSDDNSKALLFILVSGTIGITFGDNLWLRALQLLGARRLVLVDSLKPFMAAAMGTIFLNEGDVIIGNDGHFWDSFGFLFGLFLTSVGILVTGREVGEAEERCGGGGSPFGSPNAGNTPISLTEDSSATKASPTVPTVPAAEGPVSVPSNSTKSAVVADTKQEGPQPISYPEHLKTGYIMAFFNCLVDVYASVLIKGHASHWHPLLVNFIRFGITAVTIGILALIKRYLE